MSAPQKHCRQTNALARQLQPADLYDWLVTEGYFPEAYILPPCFHVSKHPRYGKRYSRPQRSSYNLKEKQVCDVHFPKTNLTDRTFAIIEPTVHSDIAYEIASGWDSVLDVLFDPENRIYSYSFPIPLSSKTPGHIGSRRAGRMIYEWLEMAENDLVEEAYTYKYIVKTDIKNFYPSVYTHSIAWAFHSKAHIRLPGNRNDFTLIGNRLDKLFQSANDGCTNGLPIGPVVSDLITEVVLSAVDKGVSQDLAAMKVLGVRYKDDYRYLCWSEPLRLDR